jgi:hypothetical protein
VALRQVGIGFAFCYYPFEIMVAGEAEQRLAMSIQMIAIKKTFTLLRNHHMTPELAA